MDSRSSNVLGTPSDTLSQNTLHPPRCESISSSSTTTNKEPSDSHSGDCPTPTPSLVNTGSSTIIAGGGSSAASTVGTVVSGGGGGSAYLTHSMSLQQQHSWKVTQPRLRFVSSVEFRHSSGETSTTPLSPESPIDDSSSEAQRPSRLQRSKAQSRKTFRLRRGRQNHGEVTVFFLIYIFSKSCHWVCCTIGHRQFPIQLNLTHKNCQNRLWPMFRGIPFRKHRPHPGTETITASKPVYCRQTVR